MKAKSEDVMLNGKSYTVFYAAGKPVKPNEIPAPGKSPETIPSEEPSPYIWPQKTPEIKPGKEPLTIPATAPPEVPLPDVSARAYYALK